MTGEEVPQDVLDAAQRGYSMHGAGLTANIVAAAWPAIEKHIRDRTPTGGLRERLVEALTREHYRRARERIEASPEEHCAAFADAVLPVVQDALAHARASCCEDGDRTYAEMERHLTQRAEEAERERDDYRQRFANQMTAATELTTTLREAERKLQQALDQIAKERRGKLAAEAAVRRSREALTRIAFGPVPTSREVLNAWRASLGADARPDETLAAVERQRDDAIAALTRHAAEAHRRKWDHQFDNKAAFDALGRLGNEILASRDRLIATIAAEQPKETPRRLTEQQGGIPNDAYTADDYPKGM